MFKIQIKKKNIHVLKYLNHVPLFILLLLEVKFKYLKTKI